MLFAMFLGIVLILLGLVFINLEDPKAKQKRILVLGIIAILCGVAVDIYTVIWVNQGWYLENQNFLGLVSKDSYLIESEGTYVYKENYPDGKGKIQTVEEKAGIEVKVYPIEKEEMPFVLVSRKQEWIGDKQKYEFYVPADNIDEN